MKILLVAATPFECAPIAQRLGWVADGGGLGDVMHLNGLEISRLVTGIGMVNTAYQLGKAFATMRPDLALQMGIGGGFAGGPAVGDVVEVVEECYPELGADSPAGFLPLAEMGFAHFEAGGQQYHNSIVQPRTPLPGMAQCKAVTVNRVSGEAAAIAALVARWSPAVESMEGAAFFQACLLAGIPFRQIRAISNRVEPRNRAAWKMQEAIAALNQTVWDLLSLAAQQRIDL
jgi:futalosine hydrolase